MAPSQRDILLAALAGGRLIRPRDLATMADGTPIPRAVLQRAVRDGLVIADSEGYRSAAAGLNIAEAKMQEIAVHHPEGVLCLEGAQIFHELTDDFPGVYPVALRRLANRRSPIENVRVVSWNDPRMYEVGVEVRDVGGNRLRITDRFRTVADMYRPQHKQPADNADSAFRTIALNDGEEGIAAVSRYAHELGWGSEVSLAVRIAKEILRCATPRS